MPDTLTPYRSAGTLTRLSDAMEELFRESFVLPRLFFERLGDGFTTVSSDLHETEDSYIVQMALPGINPEKIDIAVSGHQMTIKGSYEIPPVEKATTLRKALLTGEFSEMVSVPAEVDGGKAEATYKNGILTVKLPKRETVKATTVKVHVT